MYDTLADVNKKYPHICSALVLWGKNRKLNKSREVELKYMTITWFEFEKKNIILFCRELHKRAFCHFRTNKKWGSNYHWNVVCDKRSVDHLLYLIWNFLIYRTSFRHASNSWLSLLMKVIKCFMKASRCPTHIITSPSQPNLRHIWFWQETFYHYVKNIICHSLKLHHQTTSDSGVNHKHKRLFLLTITLRNLIISLFFYM